MVISTETWNYAVDNLLNRKVRSLLTILSIFVGVATILLFVSFGIGLYFYVENISSELGVDKIVVQTKGMGSPGMDDSFKITDDDLDVVKKSRGVDSAAGMLVASAKMESDDEIRYQNLFGFSVRDPEEYVLVRQLFQVKIMEGRELEKGDSGKAVLGYSYSVPKRIFEKPVSLHDKIIVNGHELKIIGIYQELGNPDDDGNVYVTDEAYLTITGKDRNYAMLVARVDSVTQMQDTIDRVTKNLRNYRGLEKGKEDFFVQSFEQLIETFRTSLNIIIGFVILIAFISVIISAVNTANTMFTSILERTKEIGVIKSIGATNSQILIIFLLESSILGFLAGVSGATFGALLAYVAGVVLKSLGWGFLQPALSWQLFVACVAFATIVGTVSGIIPAYNASKKNPVDALRYE